MLIRYVDISSEMTNSLCYCNASVPWCIVVMHHHRDALWCIITVMHHRYDVSTWCIQSVIRNWLYVTFYWYGACMMCWYTVWWMLMHGCWLMNDECWCMNVDEWMSVDAWMLMNEGWVLMNVDGWTMNEWWMLMDEWLTNMSAEACWWMWDVCWMMYDALMHLWCVMHWCMLNRLMCVKCMYIFWNHTCILYWFCNCFNVLILIFVFVCLSGFLYLLCCTCNKTVTLRRCVSLRHTHEPVTYKLGSWSWIYSIRMFLSSSFAHAYWNIPCWQICIISLYNAM